MSSTDHDRMMQDLESAREVVRDVVDSGVWRSPLLEEMSKEELYDLLDAAMVDGEQQAKNYALLVTQTSKTVDHARQELRCQTARADAAEARAMAAEERARATEDALRALRTDVAWALEALVLVADDGCLDPADLSGTAWPWPTDVAGLAALAEELDPAVPAG